MANPLLLIGTGIAAWGFLARFVLRKSEEETARELNAAEKDKSVSYSVAKTWEDVGEALMGFVKRYHGDVSGYDNFTFTQWYEHVRSLPYIPDQQNAGGHDMDVFCRPSRTLADSALCRDCDDKAILMACWCFRHGIPFRFVVCSYTDEEKDDVENWHCILEVQLDGAWHECDSTYSDDAFPSWRKYYNKTTISEWAGGA